MSRCRLVYSIYTTVFFYCHTYLLGDLNSVSSVAESILYVHNIVVVAMAISYLATSEIKKKLSESQSLIIGL